VKGLAEFFEKAFTAGGGKIVGKETYTAKDTDSAPSWQGRGRQTRCGLPARHYNVVNLATKQAKEKGIQAVFMGGDVGTPPTST